MPNPFVEDLDVAEQGAATAASQYFSGTTPQRPLQKQQQNTPFTAGQVRIARTPAPTTARLRRVSTSIMAAGGQNDGVDNRFGGDAAAKGRDAGFAPPKQTAQMRKFVREVPVDDGDLLTVDVTLRKEDYGEPGSSDYRKNMLMATASLPEKFGVARHKIVSDGEEGDRPKTAHVQQVIVGVIHRVKEGHKRSQAMDFMDICNISGLGGNLESENPRDWWDGTEINLWVDWDICSDVQVRRWQYSVNRFFSDEDRIASNWLQQFVYNSSTDSLRSAVAKKYDRFPPDQKGGVSYLYLTLCEMFHMSREVKDAMIKFLEIFKKNGVSRYSGENVYVVEEELLGVTKRLNAVGALTDDHVLEVLMGLSICTNKRFRDTFDLLKKNYDLDPGNLSVLKEIPVNATPMEQIDGILRKAVDLYDKLCLGGQWNATTKGGPRALQSIVGAVDTCWNCNGQGHRSKDCPKPKNKALFEKNFKAFKEAKRNGGQKGGQNGGNEGGGANTGDYNRKKWDDNHMTMVEGKLYVNCKQCGLNTTHSTKLHKAFAAKGSAWKLKADHPYAIECAKLGQFNPSIAGSVASGGTTPGQQQLPGSSSQSSGGASSMISIDRSKFEQSLADFERTSTDPNASQMSEMFRSLFLN